jgi:PBSX family phage terminase large subunit
MSAQERPSELIIKPFGRKSQDFIMRDPALDKRYTVVVGAVRSAKTFTLDAKTIVQLCRYPLPPNAKRLMTGATKQTLYRNVLIDLFNIVGQNNYSYNQSTGELWLFGKQWFCLGAKDEAAYRQILGMTVGLTVGDEVVEYPKSFLAQNFLRMSPTGARWYGSTNTGNPYCYLKADVIDKFDPASLEVINFNLDDNPNIDEEAKRAIVASQTGVYYKRYILAQWVVAEGSIYRDAFSEAANLFDGEVVVDGRRVQLEDEPEGLRAAGGHVDHWFSVDAGVDHVQSHLEYYDDGDTVWITREQRWDSRAEMRQKTDGQYADDLAAFGAEGHQVIVPPEALSLKNELVQRGFWVTDADNSVKEGIHTVAAMFSRRKLRISKRGCPNLAKRVPNYAWDDQAAKRGVEQPLKVEDDDCDSMRYGIHGKIPAWRVSGA